MVPGCRASLLPSPGPKMDETGRASGTQRPRRHRRPPSDAPPASASALPLEAHHHSPPPTVMVPPAAPSAASPLTGRDSASDEEDLQQRRHDAEQELAQVLPSAYVREGCKFHFPFFGNLTVLNSPPPGRQMCIRVRNKLAANFQFCLYLNTEKLMKMIEKYSFMVPRIWRVRHRAFGECDRSSFFFNRRISFEAHCMV